MISNSRDIQKEGFFNEIRLGGAGFMNINVSSFLTERYIHGLQVQYSLGVRVVVWIMRRGYPS